MNTVLLHPGALGDIILSLPAIAALRARFPRTRLTLAGNLDFVSATAGGIVDEVKSLSTLPLHHLYNPDALEPAVLEFWNRFDRIVAWTGFGDRVFLENTSRLRPEVVVAGWRPAPGEIRHVARIFLESVSLWLVEVPCLRPARITLAPAASEEAGNWIAKSGWADARRIVALSPGAGSAQKRWPESHFRELARRLVEDHSCRVIVFTGPAEPELGSSIARGFTADQAIGADSLNLHVVAALLSRCCAYVGNDSGLSHLAAALGIPCVVLFGPTDPKLWAPLGDRVEILRDASACRPCRRRSSASHQCLAAISPGLVMERLAAALTPSRPSAQTHFEAGALAGDRIHAGYK